MNRKKLLTQETEKEDAVREKEPKKKRQNGHDDLSVVEHLTC